MQFRIAMSCIFFVGCAGTTAFGNDFFGSHWLDSCVPDCIRKYCCDDYCPKKEPCVCAPLCFRCDDYCPKRLPCVCAPLSYRCDDYCPKCLPKVCCAPNCQHLQCGPPRCGQCNSGCSTSGNCCELAKNPGSKNARVHDDKAAEPARPKSLPQPKASLLRWVSISRPSKSK